MRSLFLLALLLPACTPSLRYPYIAMIDQRTFASVGETQAPSDVRSLPVLPLATIRFEGADADISQDLGRAVDMAQSRKPDAEFNVVTPVGRGRAPGTQAGLDAASVARALAELSVPPERIHVGVVEDSGNPAREVRVYVR